MISRPKPFKHMTSEQKINRLLSQVEQRDKFIGDLAKENKYLKQQNAAMLHQLVQYFLKGDKP